MSVSSYSLLVKAAAAVKALAILGTSLAVQWLRRCTSNAGGTGSIPGQGPKIPHAARHSQKIKTYKTSNCEKRRVHTQDIGNAVIIKRPATLNNLVYVQTALSKPQGTALLVAQW